MLRKMTLVLAILAMSVCTLNAQNAANHWLFGRGAKIRFNPGPTATAVTTINTLEGSSSISDSNGNLLFYTDGITVWTKNDTPMTNGTGLLGSPSSTHSALIVPCSCDKYFIFTTDAKENEYTNGLRYSVVDMTLSAGLGTVTSKNNLLLPKSSEKIAGISDGSGGFWVVAHTIGDDRFFSYRIGANSDCKLNPQAAIISAVGSKFLGGTADYGQGQMKFSPNGQFLAHAGLSYSPGSFLELFRFNVTTGAVTDVISGSTARDTSNDGFYGVEFSPNSQYLYATTIVNSNFLYRYNVVPTLTARTTINSYGSSQYTVAALQLAPDGRIYIARPNQQFLDYLNSPNTGGPVSTPFNLAAGTQSKLGLPTVVAGEFSCEPPAESCGVKTKEISCNTDGTGGYLYTFTVTNHTGHVVTDVLLTPKANSGITITPQQPPLPPGGIAIGASLTLQAIISGGKPNEKACFTVTFMTADGECCSTEVCAVLPDCCATTTGKFECNPRGGYMGTFSIVNTSPNTIKNIYLYPPAGVTMSQTYFAVTLAPGQSFTTPVITIKGAKPGRTCFLVSMHTEDMKDCCSVEACILLPECGIHNPY